MDGSASIAARLGAIEARLASIEEALAKSAPSTKSPDRAAAIEAALVWRTGYRPRFWHDMPVRRFVLDRYRQITLAQAATEACDLFGPERAPARSTIGDFWRRLDKAGMGAVLRGVA